jgi:hypothetical protein
MLARSWNQRASIALQRRLNIDTLTFSWYLFPYIHNSTRRQWMLPACRTADETFAIPQFAPTRSDIDSFLDELRGFQPTASGFVPLSIAEFSL